MGNLFDLDDGLIEKSNKDYSTELKKARSLCIRGQKDRALEIYESILKDEPDNEDALVGTLRVYSDNFRQLDNDFVEDVIDIIEVKCPDIMDEEYLDYVSKRDAYLISIGRKKFEYQKTDKDKELEIAIEKARNFASHYRTGTDFFEKQNYEGAIDELLIAVDNATKEEEIFDCYYYLGAAYFYLNRFNEALETYIKAIDVSNNKIDSTVQLCYLRAGLSLYQLNKYEEALEYFEKDVENGDNDEELFYHAALLYQKLRNDYAKANELYERFFANWRYEYSPYLEDACINYASNLLEGLGGKKDRFKAEQILMKGSNKGKEKCRIMLTKI